MLTFFINTIIGLVSLVLLCIPVWGISYVRNVKKWYTYLPELLLIALFCTLLWVGIYLFGTAIRSWLL
jgi:hypothetical protein